MVNIKKNKSKLKHKNAKTVQLLNFKWEKHKIFRRVKTQKFLNGQNAQMLKQSKPKNVKIA